MRKMRICDLPERMRAQVAAQIAPLAPETPAVAPERSGGAFPRHEARTLRRATQAAYNRLRRRVEKATGRKLPKPPSASGPNLTEQAFNRQILAGAGRFIGGDRRGAFAVTRLGSRYTPDFRYEFLAPDGSARTVMAEVKGAYRSAKDAGLIERRSRLAWEVAADRHPEFAWVWAKRLPRGGWECELYDPSELEAGTVEAVCRDNADFLDLLEEGLK